MIEIILITALCITVFGIIKIFFGDKKNRAGTLSIPLLSLAEQIWMKKGNEIEGNAETVSTPASVKTDPVEKSASVSTKHDGANIRAKHEEDPDSDIRSFRDECIKPYAGAIETQRVSETIEQLIARLSTYGHVPSIKADETDEEFLELSGIAHELTKTTLLRHTLTVTRILIDHVKETYSDSANMIPMAIVTGLAHDIGKMDKGNHPIRSGERLAEMLPEGIPWADHAVQAVKMHHQKTSDQFIVLLKNADMQARSYELAAHIPGYNVAPFNQWFDAERFLKNYIEPEINITQKNTCQAFSLSSCVYVRSEFLHVAANRMSKDMSILDVRFFYISEKDSTIREIVRRLQEKGYVHEMLQSPRYTMNFELLTKMVNPKKTTMQLTPLKGDIFNLQELERRKTDFLVDLKDLKQTN